MLDVELAKLRDKGFSGEVINNVREYYLRAVEERLVRGRSYRLVFYAVLFLVLRVSGFPATFSYISEISGLDEDQIYHMYVILRDKFGVRVLPVDPEALKSLRVHGRRFYDRRQDGEASIAELYREALGFVVDKRLGGVERRYVGVVTPWFMDDDERDVLWECLGKLRDYLLDVHRLDVEVLHFEYRILLRDSMPYMLEMKAVCGGMLKLDVFNVKIEDVVEVNPCTLCGYWNEGWCLGEGGHGWG